MARAFDELQENFTERICKTLANVLMDVAVDLRTITADSGMVPEYMALLFLIVAKLKH